MRQTRSAHSAPCLAKPALSRFQRTAPDCLRHTPALFGLMSGSYLILFPLRFSPVLSLLPSKSSLPILTAVDEHVQKVPQISPSFGRHYRYLVSCLTAGAKRCVGIWPCAFLVAIELNSSLLNTLILPFAVVAL